MERLLARLERRFGRYATIHGFTYYLVGLQAFVFVMELANPGFTGALILDRELILRGQVWRLFTYLFIPPSHSFIWILFALYWLYTMGTSLEAEWGSFKYQVYWLVGMVGTTIAAFALNRSASNSYLLASLLLAFATLWPDYVIYIFMILPIKVKWLGLLGAAYLLAEVGLESGLSKLFPLVAVGNYLLFFAPELIERVRRSSSRAGRVGAAAEFKRRGDAVRPAVRVCAVCGVTSDDRSIDFRVCTCEKCGKPTDFCFEHARNH